MSLKVFPKLFKKSSLGKIEEWQIEVDANSSHGPASIKTTYGELGGKLQETVDNIKEGKNIGKKNETTPLEQAVSEATSKWEKKVKSGYVDSVEKAEAGVIDSSFIEGGIVPMLAHSFAKSGEKIKYPCAVQPKLDGIRCIAVKDGDEVTLWTRTRKPITSCPHICSAIRDIFSGVSEITLDGELYNHDLKADFEKIVSAVRKESPSDESLRVQYHIYDIAREGSFKTRSNVLECHLDNQDDTHNAVLQLVPTNEVVIEGDVMERFDHYVGEGYEGVMLRNWESPYENKRSYNLQKVKEWEDAEFEITGVEEGRGKLQGLVGAFVCRTSGGEEFRAKPKGSQEATKDYIQNPDSVIGKLLTVQYQGLTKYGVPRFPVGLRVREWDL